MREVLFRGKRTDNHEWVYGGYCPSELLDQSGYEHIIVEIPYDGEQPFVEQETVGQYVGLMDKNGIKIFEGDILVLDGEDGYFKLYYDEYTARYVMEGDRLRVDFDNFYPHEVEVVGNIYDDMDLLTEEGLEIEDGE